jgi:hypothetical protein
MSRRLALLTLLVAFVASAGSAPWPPALPTLSLFDPLGTQFSDAQLKPRGVVLVATAPIKTQGDTQKAWHDVLVAQATDKSGPAVVMLEDMSQSWFRPIVIAKMKETYRPGSRIVLLLDENGATRKSFGVTEDATVAFAFAPGGRLVAVETGAPSAERALKLLEAARQQ